MKRLKNKLNKGFTLIELMVVISIIALLSSIVLAAVNDVIDESQYTKMRAEMSQLILALEMYKVDNSSYPYEYVYASGGYSYYSGMQLDGTPATGNVIALTTLLNSYTKNFPKYPIKNPGYSTTNYWTYRSNSGSDKFRCAGDTVVPRYVIIIPVQSSGNPFTQNAFSNWTATEISYSGGAYFTSVASGRCFSVK